MIAVDTNVLVVASRSDAPFHAQALSAMLALANSSRPWCIPWPCVHEFLATVTRPRYFVPPTTMPAAIATIAAWRASSSLRFIHENDQYFAILAELLASGEVVGPRVHDARIAAICIANNVSELWSADRDFDRFPKLKCQNPLAPNWSPPT